MAVKIILVLLYVVAEWVPLFDPLDGPGRYIQSLLCIVVIALGFIQYRKARNVNSVEVGIFLTISSGWFFMHSLGIIFGVDRVLEVSMTEAGDYLVYIGLSLSLLFLAFMLRILALR